MPCSQAGCDHKNSYANDIILSQLLQGLETREFREKVLQKGDNINLDDTLVLLESLECSRADNAKLEKAHGRYVAAVGTQHGAGAKGGSKKIKNGQKGVVRQGGQGQVSPLPLLWQY